MTEHALRMRQGDREIAVDEARVRALAADGKLSETAEIWDEESNRWLPAPRWYLLRSRIVARPDTDDDRYIAAHRAGELDMTSLVGLLGVSLADAEGRLHVEDGPPGGAIDLSASETRIEVDFGHDDGDARDEAIATVRAGRADERIEVPSWGRPWLLPQSRPIPVPEWKDPATARIDPNIPFGIAEAVPWSVLSPCSHKCRRAVNALCSATEHDRSRSGARAPPSHKMKEIGLAHNTEITSRT